LLCRALAFHVTALHPHTYAHLVSRCYHRHFTTAGQSVTCPECTAPDWLTQVHQGCIPASRGLMTTRSRVKMMCIRAQEKPVLAELALTLISRGACVPCPMKPPTHHSFPEPAELHVVGSENGLLVTLDEGWLLCNQPQAILRRTRMDPHWTGLEALCFPCGEWKGHTHRVDDNRDVSGLRCFQNTLPEEKTC
jgi:hypothetical protein